MLFRSRSSHGQQLYDLNQIEVVRGPQGTLYGRNTTGGAVNFITKSPQLEGQEGYFTAGYGNYNRINLEGAIEVTPSPDKFGIRLAATYVDRSEDGRVGKEGFSKCRFRGSPEPSKKQ